MNKDDVTTYEKTIRGTKGPAAQQRQEKIARYKREKALKAMIHELRERLDDEKDKQAQRAVTIGSLAGEMDQDLERDWVLALIELEISRAIEQLHGIEQEWVMVQEMEKMRQQMGTMNSVDRRAPLRQQGQESSSSTLDTQLGSQRIRGGPLLSKEGRPLQPFVITNKRQQLKDQVFQPGHNLPTMTIDEYLQQEMDRGNFIQG